MFLGTHFEFSQNMNDNPKMSRDQARQYIKDNYKTKSLNEIAVILDLTTEHLKLIYKWLGIPVEQGSLNIE